MDVTKKSFEELLVEGALIAARTLSLEELYQRQQTLIEMNLPDDITDFPAKILAVIEEKQNQRVIN